ncbi:unnamed protein product [Ranitomeya imitator]|uniref:Uncharacterized protein n=1 Tax=Ranitomeya imitator TaxID=111125 RepID=A0ABN9M1C3_9NEOB|nr:unnamed protein product [Ranitomeya imitator]
MPPPFWKMAAPREKTDGRTPGGPGNEPHICDLQTVWVDTTVKQKSDPNSHVVRIVTPEEEVFLSTKEQPHQVLWSWKVNQLIRQSLEGARDFPLWGREPENPARPPDVSAV